MSELKRSIFVIPSSALEDLPAKMGHAQAKDFLCGWTSQWDPRVLLAIPSLPEWKRAESSALDLEHSLVLCPDISQDKLDVPIREQIAVRNCILVESNARSRSDLTHAILSAIAAANGQVCEQTPGPPLHAEDFYALAYAVLQVQILARKLRYSWNIDWIMFTEQVLSAARASIANDAEETERWLQTCFDSLSQERDRYCSQQAYLLDTVLLAPNTLGPSLDRQLEAQHPFSLIATSELVQQLQERNPKAWSALGPKLSAKECSLLGGLELERPHAYLSSSAMIRDLGRGMLAYAKLGCALPKVFTRFAAGFLASSPTWLTQFGYNGAFLVAWSGGTLPEKDQAKIRWQASNDGKAIDTVLGHVLDAANADSFIDLAATLSSQLDYHHVPTVVLAHWPGIQSDALQDLHRVVARTPALGKFHTVESYFATTSQPYASDSFPSNAFKTSIPPIATEQQRLHRRLVDYESIRVQVERLWSLFHLWKQVASSSTKMFDVTLEQECRLLLSQIDSWFDTPSGANPNDTALAQVLEGSRRKLMLAIESALHGSSAANADPNSIGTLIVNPSSHPQRLFLRDLPGSLNIQSSSRIYAAETIGGRSNAVVDLPPFGFVKLQATKVRTANTLSASTLSANTQTVMKPSLWQRLGGGRTGIAQADWTLANEFMEVQLDPKKGHLRSIYISNKRGSHLSGMTSVVQAPSDVLGKWVDSDCLEIFDVRLQVIESSQLVGVIEVTGKSKLPSGVVASIKTRYTLWKGARWMNIEIAGDNIDPAVASCVWRIAWQSEAASISAWQQGIKGKLPSPLQSTVELIGIDDAEHRIFMATGGLSAHRKSGSRFLISNLPVSDTRTVHARFAIGLDWPRAYETAMDICDKPWLLETAATQNIKPDPGAWLAQCNLPHIHLSWDDPRPVLEPSSMPAAEAELWTGKTGDACLWLREMQGKSGSAKLSFFRNVAEAWRVDCQGREFDSLSVSDGQVTVYVHAGEQSRILLRWDTGTSEGNRAGAIPNE